MVTETSPFDPTALTELLAWRHRYLDELRAPRGWWSVVGLHWFGPEGNLLGRSNPALGLPGDAPARFARVHRHATGAQLERLDDTPLWLDGEPWLTPTVEVHDRSVLSLGPTPEAPALHFLQRGERFGVRVFDAAAGRARAPEGVAWFPPAGAWRLEGEWEGAAPDETLPIVNLLGDVSDAPVAGRIHLQHAGLSSVLIARPKPDGLMLHFRDATSEATPGAGGSYGAGRFLHVDAPQGGRVTVDFNRAHHPPCAHTEHATCPMPPLGNRLPFAVDAGERLP